MAKLYNLARMTTATRGTGAVVLDQAVPGFLSFAAAGLQDGETFSYAIRDHRDSEVGRGVYTESTNSFTRTVLKSTNDDGPINLRGRAEVAITPVKEDYYEDVDNLLTFDHLGVTVQAWNQRLQDISTAVPDLYDVMVGTSGGSYEPQAPTYAGNLPGMQSPQTEKWLLTADWQAVPEDAADIALQRVLMDDIEAHHSDCDFAVLSGDLVDRASDNTTGAAPSYGYPELLEDMRTRIPSIPLNRWMCIPGNHDRDGSGLGSWRWSWTNRTYQQWMGREYYYIRKGNICQIFMGDMGGSTSGEIPNYVVEWLRLVLERHQAYNVIIWMHQPLEGAHPTANTSASEWGQIQSSRISDIISTYDNILFVGYGHTGNATTRMHVETNLYGTTHIDFECAIPNGYDPVYSLMYLEAGSDEVLIRRWNAADDDYEAGEDINLTAKYPVVLGGHELDFDGRHQLSSEVPSLRGPMTIHRSIWENRSDVSSFGVQTTFMPMLNLILSDDANDNTPAGLAHGIAFYIPGTTTTIDDDGNNITTLPGYAEGMHFGAAKSQDGDEVYETELYLALKNADNSWDTTAFKVYPFSHASYGIVTDGTLNAAVVVGGVAAFGETIITSASNTTDALVITQTGTANALRINDASGDTTPLIVDFNGTMVFGAEARATNFYDHTSTLRTPQFQLHGGTNSTAGIMASLWAATTSPPALWLAKSRGAVPALTYGIVANNDNLGAIFAVGDDGAKHIIGAAQFARVDGTPALGVMPAEWIWATTNTSGTLVERLSLDPAGVLKPVTNDGVPLGTGSLSFSDLFLASGAVVNFNNGNATITHSAGLLTANVPWKVPNYTVAGLPSAATMGFGAIAFVSDANATTARSTVAGGGANKVMVFSDGTNWLIAA